VFCGAKIWCSTVAFASRTRFNETALVGESDDQCGDREWMDTVHFCQQLVHNAITSNASISLFSLSMVKTQMEFEPHTSQSSIITCCRQVGQDRLTFPPLPPLVLATASNSSMTTTCSAAAATPSPPSASPSRYVS
jgi:hypothetical protein